MLSLVIWLFIEVQRAVKRELLQLGYVRHRMRKERCTYAIVSFVFALSYVVRFYFDVFTACRDSSIFQKYVTSISVVLIEGFSMGVLMVFHMLNFKGGTLMAETRISSSIGESIVLEPLHFFSNEEIDADSSYTDESSDEVQEAPITD